MKCLIPIFVIVPLLVGCYDIFEEDISDKQVGLIAPADSVKTYYRTLTFAWEELEGATGYRLVIVSPSFERTELFVLDSLVADNRYTLKLEPGKYEWKVRPENSAYRGIYRTRQFSVLDTITNN